MAFVSQDPERSQALDHPTPISRADEGIAVGAAGLDAFAVPMKYANAARETAVAVVTVIAVEKCGDTFAVEFNDGTCAIFTYLAGPRLCVGDQADARFDGTGQVRFILVTGVCWASVRAHAVSQEDALAIFS